MLYMVQMLDDAETWDAEMAKFGPEDMRKMFSYMEAVNKELADSGEWVEGRGLGGPTAVTTVSAVAGGAPRVTDGPHDPKGRILSGYWVIDVSSRDRAVELAARISAAPGPGGEAYNFPVELHLIPEEPPSA